MHALPVVTLHVYATNYRLGAVLRVDAGRDQLRLRGVHVCGSGRQDVHAQFERLLA